MKKCSAEKAIKLTAEKEGVSVKEIRRQLELAILAGIASLDPSTRDKWKKVPCESDIPTPEELITYIATHVGCGLDPFA